MDDLFAKLKRYFEETPREKILEDWAESRKKAGRGPTVDEFIKSSKRYHSWQEDDFYVITETFKNPKYTSGSLLLGSQFSTY